MLLDEESIKLTTFIMELGQYQYHRAPQGNLASDDAYTRRYDDIIADVLRKKLSLKKLSFKKLSSMSLTIYNCVVKMVSH